MIIPKLALRNLLGAGIRTWLNVIVLSFSFVAIIWTQGIYKGMNDQVEKATVDALHGGGEYWQSDYDPYDLLTLEDAHAPIPDELNKLISEDEATAILIRQATIYPNGRIKNVMLKGIDPDQKILITPTFILKSDDEIIPALIGSRMSHSTGLKVGDYITVQWRDANGTFDAQEIKIVEVMKTNVQAIDNAQLWIPLDRMQQITAMEGEATMVVLKKGSTYSQQFTDWNFKDLEFLLQDLRALVKQKSVGASILYFVLLFLAGLAIFDTQVLSIFRRKKEIGTLMSLGMTRFKIIQLFTFEGAMHGILAAIVAAVYGTPLLIYTAVEGWALPGSADSYGLAIGEKLFPTYSAALVIGTTILVFMITTIVSYWPTRRIAKLKPTDALRGKLS